MVFWDKAGRLELSNSNSLSEEILNGKHMPGISKFKL